MEKIIEDTIDGIWNHTEFPFLTVEQMYIVVDELKKQVDNIKKASK